MTIYNLFKQKHSVSSLLIIALLVLQLIGALIIGGKVTAKAEPDPNIIKERVFSFQAYALMNDTLGGGCAWITNEGLTSNPGTWLSNGDVSSGTAFNEYVGVRTDSGDIHCFENEGSSWITRAINLWGYSLPEDFLKAIAAQCSNQCMYLNDGNGKFYVKDQQGTRNAVKAILTKENAYYAGANLDSLSQAETYYDALRNFTVQCNATFNSSNVSSGNDDKLTQETTGVNSNGEFTTGYWHYNPNKNQVAVGSALRLGNEVTCNKLASVVTDTALINAFKEWVNKNGMPDGASSTDPKGEGRDGEAESCYSWSPLSWIMCPIIDLADGLYSFLADQIKNLLIVESSLYDNSGLKESWSAIRNVASALIVLVALVMIASQIFNFEFLSAYSIKKVLPRLLIAAIFIQLSWIMFTTLIVIFNAIGDGVSSLLLAPFNLNGSNGDIMNMIGGSGEGAKIFGGAVLLLGAGAGFIAIGGLAGIAGAAIAVSIAILVALVTLILRKMLLIVLLVLAPLALVFWILPGTQKYWSTWWNLFIKLLIMYPLIMALIASGKIFAYLVGETDTAVGFLMMIIAYFIPLFFIPATFKFAGGIFTQASGIMNGLGNKWGKSAGESTKGKLSGWGASKYGQNRTKNAFARATTGNIIPGRTRRARTASAGLKYEQERKNEVEALIGSQISGKQFNDQIETLEKLALNNKDEKVAGAALAKLASLNQFDKVANISKKRRALFDKVNNTDAAFGKAVAESRPDLVMPGEKITAKSAQDALKFHDSFWATDAAQYVSSDVIKEIKENSNLRSQLQQNGREFIDTGSVSGSATPIINPANSDGMSIQQKAAASANTSPTGTGRSTNIDSEALRNMNSVNMANWIQSRGGADSMSTQDLIAARNSMAGRLNPSNVDTYDPGLEDIHRDITNTLIQRNVLNISHRENSSNHQNQEPRNSNNPNGRLP